MSKFGKKLDKSWAKYRRRVKCEKLTDITILYGINVTQIKATYQYKTGPDYAEYFICGFVNQ